MSCGRRAKKENKNGLVRDISKESRHYIVVTGNRKNMQASKKIRECSNRRKKKRKK